MLLFPDAVSNFGPVISIKHPRISRGFSSQLVPTAPKPFIKAAKMSLPHLDMLPVWQNVPRTNLSKDDGIAAKWRWAIININYCISLICALLTLRV